MSGVPYVPIKIPKLKSKFKAGDKAQLKPGTEFLRIIYPKIKMDTIYNVFTVEFKNNRVFLHLAEENDIFPFVVIQEVVFDRINTFKIGKDQIADIDSRKLIAEIKDDELVVYDAGCLNE